MSYNLHFVGLVCFTQVAGGFKALLPNGQSHNAPHLSAIVAAPNAAIEWEWWNSPDDHSDGVFRIEDPVDLDFAGTGPPDPVNLNVAEWTFLPNLHKLDPLFQLSNSPKTIATARLMNGTFIVREHPNGCAVVSTLALSHDGVIRVEAGGRFIRFRAGTELALVNVGQVYLQTLMVPAEATFTADGRMEDDDDECLHGDDADHFQIYYQLASSSHGTFLPVPPRKSRQKVFSTHPVFEKKPGRTLRIGCSNTGCC